MITIDLDTWEDFETAHRRLVQERTDRKSATGRSSPEFLYRGQGSSQWQLETTLEREQAGEFSLIRYHRLICRVRPQIETFTNTNWVVPSPPDYESWLKQIDPPFFPNMPAYDYMAYLRHYGFPSPMLDWSRSVYVAAYFAFSCARNKDDRISIFIYWESPDGIKGGAVGESQIVIFSPYVRTHNRHFLQQSQYTICVARKSNEWCYAPHEDAFARDEPDQDLLWKYNIPASERLKVLKILDTYNLNDYSLFSSEESLMRTMALRELHFH